MAKYQYNRKFFYRDFKSGEFVEFMDVVCVSETETIILNNADIEKVAELKINLPEYKTKLPAGYYFYRDPELSYQKMDLKVETSFNIFFNIGLEEEYKKKEIKLRPMYIGYMINDNGDMLFKIEDEEKKLDKYVATIYTFPLDFKTKLLPLVSYKGENLIKSGKGFSSIVDTTYSPSKHEDMKDWIKFGDPWFIALTNNKGYENDTVRLQEYCAKVNQYDDGHNLLHSIYVGKLSYSEMPLFDESKLLNEERKKHGKEPIEFYEHWEEDIRSFYVFKKHSIEIGYDELDPAENVEKYRHKKTENLPADVRADPDDYLPKEETKGGEESKFNLELPYNYYFILKINTRIDEFPCQTIVSINGVIVFASEMDEQPQEYVLNSLNQTSTNYNRVSVLNFNVELEQGENIIQKKNCSVDLEVHMIQSSIDYV